MNSSAQQHTLLRMRLRGILTISLVISFALWTAFVFNFDVFIDPPGAGNKDVFIVEAKGYYFEKSDIYQKDMRFDAPVYRDLWLSVPGVSKVVTTDEIPGRDRDLFESDFIRYVTINGVTINLLDVPKLDDSQQQLYYGTLNQVSAAAWEWEKQCLVRDALIWLGLAAVLAAWIIYLKKFPLCNKDSSGIIIATGDRWGNETHPQ